MARNKTHFAGDGESNTLCGDSIHTTYCVNNATERNMLGVWSGETQQSAFGCLRAAELASSRY